MEKWAALTIQSENTTDMEKGASSALGLFSLKTLTGAGKRK